MESDQNYNLIRDLSFQFALKIVAYTQLLEKERKYTIATQLLKSGTSIGANVSEAQNPESRADFIHKLKIAAKEAGETRYWLQICDQSEGFPESKFLIQETISISKVLSKIISSTKKVIS